MFDRALSRSKVYQGGIFMTIICSLSQCLSVNVTETKRTLYQSTGLCNANGKEKNERKSNKFCVTYT